MKLMNVPQHKWLGVDNRMVWRDDYKIVKTADNMNAGFIAVCCSTENQIIAPRAISFHAC